MRVWLIEGLGVLLLSALMLTAYVQAFDLVNRTLAAQTQLPPVHGCLIPPGMAWWHENDPECWK